MDSARGPLLSSLGLLGLVLLLLLHASSGDRPLPAPTLEPAAPVSAPPEAKAPTPAELLAERDLVVPVQGVRPGQLRDTYEARRGVGRKHRALDIMAPWGTPVLAADDGRLAKITSNRAGGLTLYQVDPTGRFVYYYAHLTGYADGLREGQQVRRGEVIAYVGATGNAAKNAPHLHFQVMVMAEGRGWWRGEPVNPYQALVQ